MSKIVHWKRAGLWIDPFAVSAVTTSPQHLGAALVSVGTLTLAVPLNGTSVQGVVDEINALRAAATKGEIFGEQPDTTYEFKPIIVADGNGKRGRQ